MDARVPTELHRRPLVFGAAENAMLPAAHALVSEVYRGRLSLEVGTCRDALPPDTRVLVVQDGQSTVLATLTVQAQRFALDAGRTLDAAKLYQLDSLGVAPSELAEVSRVAARPNCPDALHLLYRQAAALCLRAGAKYFLGLVESGGDVTAIPAYWRSIERAGLIDRDHFLEPLTESNTLAAEIRGYAGPSSETLPARVRTFARDLNAKVCGFTARHPHFPSRLVTPMWASLTALVAPTRASQGED